MSGKYFLRFLFFVAFLNLNNDCYAQYSPDENFLQIEDKMRYYFNRFNDSVPFYCKKLQKNKSLIVRVYAYAALSYNYALSGKTEKFKSNLSYSKKLLKKIKNVNEKNYLSATVYNFEGSSLKYNQEFSKALSVYLKGKSYAEKCQNIPLQVRFFHNISDIQASIGDFSSAISNLKKEVQLLKKNKEDFSEENYSVYRINTLITLGKVYNDYYVDINKNRLLDSSKHYYNLAFVESQPQTLNYAICELNLGVIYIIRKQYLKAKELLSDAEIFFHNNKHLKEEQIVTFNLAVANYELKNYDQSLAYFIRYDKFYLKDSIDEKQFENSQYLQSQIYKLKGNIDLYNKKQEEYLAIREKSLMKEVDDEKKVSKLILQDDYNSKLKEAKGSFNRTTKIIIGLAISISILIILVFVYLFLKNKKLKPNQGSIIAVQNESIEEESLPYQTIKIDEVTEQEILKKLEKLIQEEYFLKPEFKLQNVAKKIKTNTSYLSHVVNVKFGQTFSEYSVQLKLEYIIQKLENEPRFREYSTQALAESVGYKNAISFAKLFSKKTGLTPYQFVMNLKNMD